MQNGSHNLRVRATGEKITEFTGHMSSHETSVVHQDGLAHIFKNQDHKWLALIGQLLRSMEEGGLATFRALHHQGAVEMV